MSILCLRRCALAVLLSFSLTGESAWYRRAKSTPSDEAVPAPDAGWVLPKADQKTDAFLAVLDASSSMSRTHRGSTSFAAAKDILRRMNAAIVDLDLVGGLRFYGRNLIPFRGRTELVCGVGPYSASDFAGALQGVRWCGGSSPLSAALSAAQQDLQGTEGKIAVIVVSDGVEIEVSPAPSAEELSAAFGDRLSIYTVAVGGDTGGRVVLDEVARAGQGGFSVSGDDLSSDAGMRGFVEQVFGGKKFPPREPAVAVAPVKAEAPVVAAEAETAAAEAKDSDGDGVPDKDDRHPSTPQGVEVDAQGRPLDSDGDGVPDFADKHLNTPSGVQVDAQGCPLDSDGDGVGDYLDRHAGTPKGVKVDQHGCPVDSDGDGVPDYLDKHADTPAGVAVDKQGCPLDSDGDGVPDYRDRGPNTPRGGRVNKDGRWVLDPVLFSFKEKGVGVTHQQILDELVTLLTQNPDARLEIEGHTDNIGSADYNLELSRERATAAMNYMISKGIARDRLTVKAYGFSRPVATNATPEGRARNRRVQFRLHR